MKATFTKIRLLRAAVWLVLTGLGSGTYAQRQNLIFEQTFENANFVTNFVSPNNFTQFANAEKCCSYSITRSSDVLRSLISVSPILWAIATARSS